MKDAWREVNTIIFIIQYGKFLVQVTEESFIDGGFFKTGDTVTIDEDGYFKILGRKYIMILQYHVFMLAVFILTVILCRWYILICTNSCRHKR
jgi:acyl-CoA synthetase (AMP-forming)/AMP-acid ligase II